MATSVVPALLDALVTNARANLPNLNVLDGLGVTDDPGDFLMVGVDTPESDSAAQSADSTQGWAFANTTTRDEEGDVWCVAYSWSGDNNQKSARDAAYATVAAVENMLRTNVTQDVPNILWAEVTTQSLKQNQTDRGAVAQVAFQIRFRARI